MKKLFAAFLAVALPVVVFAGCSKEPQPVTLKSVIGSEDSIQGRAGVCVPYDALSDDARMELVCREYNSITCENEMKPESILGQTPTFSNDVDAYGNKIPELDFTRADAILDYILDYNSKNPKDQILVRGHVLVWHSQTPTWFFREGYSATGDYVTPDEMLYREEWYIKSVIEHFDGEGSPYHGLIYAWDVVNEQIEPGDRRSDTNPDSLRLKHNGQPTDWYQVFQGDDAYITQAFVFANKYAPATVKLFYNDYNDSNMPKARAICQLIEKIKATDGARIDGMGMQGHYGIDWDYAINIEKALRLYSEVVDEVQITELDLQTGSQYDGYHYEEEYERQAKWYELFFNMIARLDHEDGIDVTAVTFWGTHDSVSWLNQSSSVGGGANGSRDQMPLLFDKDMNKKPAYYVVTGTQPEAAEET
ncbi:MAG: endo-1,4-beta-xylanase [Saccharofermentans sp.]|nr:endo-1,4-beta-xylanase [Saccharofermentans sp.]